MSVGQRVFLDHHTMSMWTDIPEAPPRQGGIFPLPSSLPVEEKTISTHLTEDEKLLREPLGVLQERYHWSEIQAMAELQQAARRMLLASGASVSNTTPDRATSSSRSAAAGEVNTPQHSVREQGVDEDVHWISSLQKEAMKVCGDEVDSTTKETGSSSLPSLLSLVATPVWDLLQDRHAPLTGAAAPLSCSRVVAAARIAPPLSTGFPLLDVTLLGGLRPQFLTEFITPHGWTTSFSSAPRASEPYPWNPSPRHGLRHGDYRKTGKGDGLSLPFTCHTPLFSQPIRILMVRIALNVLQRDPAAMVWWLHPSPDDGLLHQLFSCVWQEEKTEDAKGTDVREEVVISTVKEGVEEKITKDSFWQQRVLFSPLHSVTALRECTKAFADKVMALPLPSSFFGSCFPRVRLVVVEDLPLLLHRGRESLTGSFTTSSFSASSTDHGVTLHTLVEQWKQVAFSQHIVVVFLNTSRVACSWPTSPTAASVQVVPREKDTHSTLFPRPPMEVSVEEAHPLGRAFSHAMNIRMVLYPGWMAVTQRRTLLKEKKVPFPHSPFSSSSVCGRTRTVGCRTVRQGEKEPHDEEEETENMLLFHIKIIKSPLSGGAVLAFRLKPISPPKAFQLCEICIDEEENKTEKVAEMKDWYWRWLPPYPLLAALDPLDYVLST